MSPLNEDLKWAAVTYNLSQLTPHAEACKAGKCTSYIHCFFGIPRGFGNGVPNPVCAQRIILEKQKLLAFLKEDLKDGQDI